MGVYLSSPVTEKESVNEDCPDQGLCYGASSMQGWRITQEDAHNCIPIFDKKSQTSFFAVYDGHGGSEVAKYCERHLPDFVKNLMESATDWEQDNSKATKFIQSAFLAFDATLTTDDVIKELKSLAGKEDDNDEEDEDDPVGRTETDLLNEEAQMPLEEVLAQYGSSTENKENSNNHGEASSSGVSSSSSIDESLASSTSSSSSSSVKQNSSASASSSSAAATSSSFVNSKDSTSHKADTKENGETSVSESSNNNNNNNAKDAVPSTPGKSESPDTTAGGPSGSGTKSNAASSGKSNKPEIDSDDDDEDEDEDDDDMWEDMSDDDEEDDDDDDDDDSAAEKDKDVPMMDTTDEEPGSDSGCTACVLLKHGKRLIVANAGDSRCVLARAGQAVELSFDHKPEDEPELTRIEHAGGKVTADGRVNGGLNLSRAIGDHVYKRNTEVTAREQMITALPDVQVEELCEEDQFLVIACDGIWNSMTSQEVVDFVLVKLKDPKKRKEPALICEDLFDQCLAPNTFGDGTGCDNMTCIIVVLDTFTANAENEVKSSVVTTNSDSKDVDGESSDPQQVSSSGSREDDSTTGNDSKVTTQSVDSSSESASLDEKASKSLKRCADNVDMTEKKRLKVEENVA